jgi:hypothetical protein
MIDALDPDSPHFTFRNMWDDKLIPESSTTGATPLNDMARDVHRDNQHWWHDPATGVKLTRNKGEMFMLMVSEVAEAMEGERKNLMDDKLPHRPMAEVEMADTVIRMMDYAGAVKFNLDQGVLGVPLPKMPGNTGEMLLQIAFELTQAGLDDSLHWTQWRMCRALKMIERYCDVYGYDLTGAIKEKRAFNASRPDHKAAARLAANGKKW